MGLHQDDYKIALNALAKQIGKERSIGFETNGILLQLVYNGVYLLPRQCCKQC